MTNATTSPRKSRASRAAERAAQDQAQSGQPDDVAGKSDVVTDDVAGKPDAVEAKPELPTAAGDLGKGRITYYWPSITLPDGSEVQCPHSTWGHGAEKPAMACLRKLAADHGVELAKS